MLRFARFTALLLCAAAVRAEEVQPIIERPITLRAGRLELTLHGTYTNWGTGVPANSGVPSTFSGETLAVGADFGVTDEVEAGLAIALPIHPGAAFGSIVGSTAIALDRGVAFRADAGYERTGVNGASDMLTGHADRFFGGLGVRIKAPITSTVAFVTGRSGAVQFGHFNNVGVDELGFYGGGSVYAEASSDSLVLSGGNGGTTTTVGINLPVGLL